MKGRDWHQALAAFVAETDRALDLFAGFMPEVRALGDAETLTFLHGTISTRRHVVAVPETPMYLDCVLVEAPPLFVIGDDGEAQLVNYRVAGRYYVVDRLFGAAELRLGGKRQQVVRIERAAEKRARRRAGRAS